MFDAEQSVYRGFKKSNLLQKEHALMNQNSKVKPQQKAERHFAEGNCNVERSFSVCLSLQVTTYFKHSPLTHYMYRFDSTWETGVRVPWETPAFTCGKLSFNLTHALSLTLTT